MRHLPPLEERGPTCWKSSPAVVSSAAPPEPGAGLHVPFVQSPDGSSRAEDVARSEHVGWPEIIHGGLLFTLMDEAVAWAVIYAGLRTA